jgi:hypothetical protein
VGQTIPLPQPDLDPATVTVHDGVVHISDLEDADTELFALVADAPDAAQAVRQCLRLGARAANAVQVSVDTDLVERCFDDMTTRFDARVAAAVESIGEITEGLLDAEDGALTGTLDGHRTALEEMLGATFDPNSKKSVLTLFETVMRESAEAQQASVRKLVSLDGEDSPLGRLKRELAREVKDQLVEVKGDLKEISEKIAVNSAVAPVIALTSGKGFAFEDLVDVHLSQLASVHGDLAEQTGHHLGSTASKKGDEVITICRDDLGGCDGRIAVEVKARNLSMRDTMLELDAAMANRDAQVGIAVFSSQDFAPTHVPFHYTENKAIVVLDPDESDPSALRLAYMWGRWVTRRTVAATSDAALLDRERITRLIDDACRSLERTKAIRSAHTKAHKAIDQAHDQLGLLSDEASEALRLLSLELEQVVDNAP